jgi:hypothetical protein
MTEVSKSSLKDLKATLKPTGLLLPHVNRHLLKMNAEGDLTRDHSHLHPSDMAKSEWCSRRAFYRVEGYPKSDKVNASYRLENIFAEGHAIHHKWQKWLWEIGCLWGKWKCLDCGDTFYATSPECCDSCGGLISYAEVPLRSDPEYMIQGHSDGAVVLDGNKYLIEIKSIGVGTLRFEAPELNKKLTSGEMTLSQVWTSINRPFPSHLRQGLIYLELARHHEFLESVDEIIFIYEWKPSQDVKEFTIKRNSDLISRLLTDAKDVKSCIDSGSVPDRPDWATNSSARHCKKCDYLEECWNESHVGEPNVVKRPIKKASSARRRKALGSSKR